MSRRAALAAFLAVFILCAVGIAAFAAWTLRGVEARHPPEGSFVEVEGVRLHFVDRPADAPEPDAPPIVLIHGAAGSSADILLALGTRLGARHRVIAFDRPGLGWSGRPDTPDAAVPLYQANMLRAALTQIGVTRAIVVGHSLGGTVALAFAFAHPQATEGLVLLAPVSHPWFGGVEWYYHVAANPLLGPVFNWMVAAPLGLALIDRAIPSAFAPETPPPGYRMRAAASLILAPSRWRANAEDMVTLHSAVVWQQSQYPSITAPTVILAGTGDDTVSAELHARSLARQIAGAELVLLPGVGHMLHHAAPDAVADAVARLAARAAVPAD